MINLVMLTNPNVKTCQFLDTQINNCKKILKVVLQIKSCSDPKTLQYNLIFYVTFYQPFALIIQLMIQSKVQNRG